MFFSKKGIYKEAGLYSLGHLVILIITIVCIAIAYNLTKKWKKEKVQKLIKYFAVIFSCLEIIKIILSIRSNSIKDVNTYLPLYYCSGFIYALILSSLKGSHLKKTGNVFLQTGSPIGGLIFLICPSTSLTYYPIFHYISVYSFAYHGAMIYLGLLMNKIRYEEISSKDFRYYYIFIGVLCLVALFINNLCDANLMFISKDFPGTFVGFMYKHFKTIFTFVMCLGQMTLPFFAYVLIENIKMRKIKIRK